MQSFAKNVLILTGKILIQCIVNCVEMSDRNIFGIKKRNKFLDDEVKDRLLFAISQGSYIVDACAYAGISQSTYYNWREKADRGEEFFVNLFEEIATIEATFKVDTVKKIKDIGEEDRNPRALQWILEKRYPEQFGDTSKLVVTTDENVINVIQFSDGTLANELPDGVIDELEDGHVGHEEQEKINNAKIDDYD